MGAATPEPSNGRWGWGWGGRARPPWMRPELGERPGSPGASRSRGGAERSARGSGRSGAPSASRLALLTFRGLSRGPVSPTRGPMARPTWPQGPPNPTRPLTSAHAGPGQIRARSGLGPRGGDLGLFLPRVPTCSLPWCESPLHFPGPEGGPAGSREHERARAVASTALDRLLALTHGRARSPLSHPSSALAPRASPCPPPLPPACKEGGPGQKGGGRPGPLPWSLEQWSGPRWGRAE